MGLITKPRFRTGGNLIGRLTQTAGTIREGLSRQQPKCSLTRSLSGQPVVELREDALYPQHSRSYYDHFFDRSRNSNGNIVYPSRLCFLSRPELGGPLNVATHAYYFPDGLAELQNQRKTTDETLESKNDLHVYIQSQQSSVYVEAPLVREQSDFVVGLEKMSLLGAAKGVGDDPGANSNKNNCILELRRYHLRLGYDTVPKFLELYGAGLPSKLQAPGTDPTTSLVTVLYSEIGRLNEVIEIWRHGNGVPAMEQSRAAARKAQEWRNAISSIADLALEFRSTIHRPLLAPPMDGSKR
mmetsp:Transcript_10885/g.23072  ORF Transcript_10885/g.23072 Transcript_10885/m.23072 type:complete len:298 (-) Transcript_10885:181-1074(-)